MASTSAKYLRATISGVNISGLTDWTVRESGDVLDATDSNSGGIEQVDVGIINPEIRVSGYHKLANGPFPALRTGTIITNLQLYANVNVPAAAWSFDRVVVVECEQPVQVRGQIRYSFVARNTETAAGTSASLYTGPTA